MIVRVKRLRSEARLPTRSHADDAGLDLYDPSDDGWRIPVGRTIAVPVGIAIELPAGHFGLIRERSGHAVRGLTVLGGVIDPGFRGELIVLLHNCGDRAIELPPQSRIAQLLVLPIPPVTIVETDSLPPASRGDAGFGSTGG